MATFRLRTVGALLVGALLLTAGCVSPSSSRDWETKTFELPYLLDYEVVNRATFAWRDDYLAQSSFVKFVLPFCREPELFCTNEWGFAIIPA